MKLTLLDLAKRTTNDVTVGIVDATTQANALLALLPFRGIVGGSFKYARRVGLPTVSFRGVNQGVDTSKSVIEQILFETKNIGGRSQIDKTLAHLDPRGVNVLRAEEDAGFAASMGNIFNLKAFYGSSKTTKGLEFDGLSTQLNLLSKATVIDGGSSSASAVTSVYAVAFKDANSVDGRLRGVEGILSNNQSIEAIDMGLQYATDADSKQYLAYTTEFEFAPGFAVYDDRSIGRIANLDLTDSPTTTDLINLEAAMRPFKISAFFVSSQTWVQLQKIKLTALNTFNSDVDLFINVLTFNNIPIFIDDNIVNTEEVVV